MGINEMMRLNGLIKPRGKRKTVIQEVGEVAKTNEVCIELDHPQQGEKITAPHYTFRIGVYGDTERVEISINQGHWQPCRHSVGYWWYDWSGYTKGRHQVVARARTKDGQVFTSETRKFQVV